MIFFWPGLAVSGWLKAIESKTCLGRGGHPRRGSAPVFRKIPPVVCSETIRAFMGPSAQIGQVCSALTANGSSAASDSGGRFRKGVLRKDPGRAWERTPGCFRVTGRLLPWGDDRMPGLGCFSQKVETDSGHWEKRLCHLQTHTIDLYYAHGKEWARLHPMPDRPGKTIPCRR